MEWCCVLVENDDDGKHDDGDDGDGLREMTGSVG